MKTINIVYWVSTVLFGAFMVFSSIGSVMMMPEAVDFIKGLGYPEYIIPFLGVAKILGVIAILVPGFPRIKEWAYAGLAIDLVGALFSLVSVHGFQPDMFPMAVPFVLGGLSYVYYHKRMKDA